MKLEMFKKDQACIGQIIWQTETEKIAFYSKFQKQKRSKIEVKKNQDSF